VAASGIALQAGNSGAAAAITALEPTIRMKPRRAGVGAGVGRVSDMAASCSK
jgi:hypothetical protein